MLQTSIRQLLADSSSKTSNKVPFSMEFFPPRNANEEQRLWNSVRTIANLGALFATVTYGAGGAHRHRTITVAQAIQDNYHIPVLTHVTTVNQTRAEITDTVSELWNKNLRHVLALRGDPPGDPLGSWVATPGGLDYAGDLVDLLREQAPFEVAVAAFPEGHFRAPSLEHDTHILVDKFRRGAQFAITQMFFNVDDYFRLRDRVAKTAPEFSEVPLVPGIMPITSVKVIRKLLQLSGSTMPAELQHRLDAAAGDDEDKNRLAVREVGIDIATSMSQRLLSEGAPCLHFCTLNYTKSARDVLKNLGVDIPATTPPNPATDPPVKMFS